MQIRIDQLTEQLKAAWLAVDETQKKIRTWVEAIPVGLAVVDETLAIEGANPHCLSLFKCDRADLIKRPLGTILDIANRSELFSEAVWNRGNRKKSRPLERTANVFQRRLSPSRSKNAALTSFW
jgi:PAS domain-containing protein